MNKAKFFRLCQEGKAGFPEVRLYLQIGSPYRESDREVQLCGGAWAGGGLSTISIYRPTPGRQVEDCYQAAIAACEKALPKFERWLREWESEQ